MNNTIIYILAFCLLLTACKKEITPLPAGETNAHSAALNLYSASDLQYLLSLDRFVFIDMPVDTVSTHITGIPAFMATNTIDQQEYPVVSISDAYNTVNYTRITAGSHRVLFTDGYRQVIQDTSLVLADESYTSLYITDAGNNGEPASYRLLSVPEQHTGTAGRVRIRMVHLSPDTGPLSCYLINPDSSLLFSPLPQKLAFGTASPYIELDPAAAIQGKLNVQIIADKDPLHPLLLTRLPAIPDHSYVIVVKGFRQPATRQVPNGRNPNGTTKYQTITIPANLRTNIRETY